MSLAHQIGPASGTSLSACAFLAYRCDARFGLEPSRMESWVLEASAGRVSALLSAPGWLSGLWRSPAGRVFVTDVAGRVHVHDASAASSGLSPWQSFDLRGSLGGIWGLGDDLAFVWAKTAEGDAMFRWDGARFDQVASPGPVLAMHGRTPDAIYACGERGLVARWDGTRFHSFDPPTEAALWDVHAREGEIAVCGPLAGALSLGPEGWVPRADASVAPECIAWWNGATWIGSAERGLLRVAGDEVGAIAGVQARRLDAREALVVSSPDAVLSSTDGRTFTPIPAGTFVSISAAQPPRWRMDPDDDPFSLEADVEVE